MKPNCYECIHRGTIPGDAHSCCNHPQSGINTDSIAKLMAIFSSVRRVSPCLCAEGIAALGIDANMHGVENGWFNWPYNFDPVWLNTCTGFEATTKGETPDVRPT